ncbi:MAG: YigZ family protein [Clostridia bacterium]|nr:YigZ family protein [Clostridia bacterium]
MESYKTVLKEAEDSFIERKSRFIGYCKPITTEQEALDFIKAKKSEHWDATHNVYAYILREGGIMRYSDDGEPQGTAGVPVLEALRKADITDAVVVVTRYFGGILLGAGGLVRAYSHGAVLGIQAAEPVTMTMCKQLKLRVDYTYFTKAQSIIESNGGVLTNTEYDDAVNLEFHIIPENIEALKQDIADLTGGKGIFKETGEGFYGIK